MATAKRAETRLGFSELIAEGSDFARDAFRDCWLAILLVALVQTFLFARSHVAPAEWPRSVFDWIVPLGVLFYVPLYGGLYRAALGGRPFASMGPGGLQWTGLEWRLIAVGVVIAFLIGLATMPFFAITGVLALIFHRSPLVSLGPFGSLTTWALASIPVWLVFFVVMAPRIARLMLGWPYSVAREKIEPFAGWGPGKASGWPLAFAIVAAFMPLVLGWLAIYALTLVEPDALTEQGWPLPEAIGVGLLLGLLKAAIVAPMGAGVLACAYWLLEGGEMSEEAPAEAGEHHHHPLPDDAAAAAAAALSAHEAAELGLEPAQVDPAAAEHAASEEGVHSEEAAHPVPDEALAADTEAMHVPEHEPVPEVLPEPIPAEAEIPSVEAAPHAESLEPLSPWPHSVLPPWPTRTSAEPASEPVVAKVSEPDVQAAPAEALVAAPLASAAEPAHPSEEAAERD